MQAVKDHILEKLDQMPEPTLRKVLDFIERILPDNGAEDDPILAVAGILSGDGLTSKEIEIELYGEDITRNE